MSTLADPSLAYVWLDGDGYRAPENTALPTDPFATHPVTSAVTWDAFGGIEAGFNIDPKRDVKPLPVWNRRSAPYKVIKSPKEERVKLRPVDYSPAAALTILEGGSIVRVSTGIYRWDTGTSENFALLLNVRDSGKYAGFYSPSVTLTTPPPRTFGGETLDGFELELFALSPFQPLTSWNPFTRTYTATIGGTPTGGTFTLSFFGQTTSALAYNAAASAVQTALLALSTIGTGNATVTGSAGGPYTIVISAPGILTADASGLTPSGTVTIA